MRYHTQFRSNDPLLTLKTQHPTHSHMSTRRPSISSLSTNRSQTACANIFYSNQAEITSRLALSRKRSRDDSEASHLSTTNPYLQQLSRHELHQQNGKKIPQTETDGQFSSSRSSPLAGPLSEKQKMRTSTKPTTTLELDRKALLGSDVPVSKCRKVDSATQFQSNDPTFRERRSPDYREESIIDNFTLHLGIGWSSLSITDPDTQAATRGWVKFIETHFPLSNVRIRLQSKGLASYLIESNEGYFLFGEDLKQGRLVSVDIEKTLVNLQGACPIFEGETMEASQSSGTSPTPNLMDGNFSYFQGFKAPSTSLDLKALELDERRSIPALEAVMDLS